MFLPLFVDPELVVRVLPQSYHFQKRWSNPLLKCPPLNLPRNQPGLLLKEPRKHPNEKRRLNRSPTRLRRLRPQHKELHPNGDLLLNRC